MDLNSQSWFFLMKIVFIFTPSFRIWGQKGRFLFYKSEMTLKPVWTIFLSEEVNLIELWPHQCLTTFIRKFFRIILHLQSFEGGNQFPVSSQNRNKQKIVRSNAYKYTKCLPKKLSSSCNCVSFTFKISEEIS